MESDGEWKDLMGKDIQMKIIKEGTGPIAELHTVVICDYSLCLVAAPQDIIESVTNQAFEVGESDAIPGKCIMGRHFDETGLELALRNSRVGSHFFVRCTSKFGFGSEGRSALTTAQGTGSGAAIPPDSDLEYEVIVYEHRVYETGGYQAIELRKICGLRWYHYSDFTRAGRCYSKAAQAAEKLIEALQQMSEAEAEAPPISSPRSPRAERSNSTASATERSSETTLAVVEELLVVCLSNLAQCHLRCNDAFKAREACIRALEYNPTHTKTLYRAASASLQLHNYEESLACAKRLKELEPKNTSVEPLLARIHKRIAEYKAKEKQMSASMASRMFKAKEGDVSTARKDTVERTPPISAAEPVPTISPTASVPTTSKDYHASTSAAESVSKQSQTSTVEVTGSAEVAIEKKNETPIWLYLVVIAILLAINALLVMALIYY